MEKRVIEFLNLHRISALGVSIPGDGVHVATMHYAFDWENMMVYFVTSIESRKMLAVKEGESQAGLTIGFSEEEWVTVQMEGKIKELDGEAREKAWGVFTKKFMSGVERMTDDTHTILGFKVEWWRYSKVKPKPMEVISSD